MTDHIERAERLAPLLERMAPAMERAHQLAPEVVAALHEAQFYRLLLPRSLGGAELPPAEFVQVIETIAKADASTAWCLAQAGGCAMSGAYLPPATAREVFGPANAVLAWGPPNGGARAVPCDGGYILDGTWQFASGSRHATWLGAHAMIHGRDGISANAGAPSPFEPTFLFPRANAIIEDTWQVVGLKATGSDTYTAKDLFVPETHVFLRDDPKRRTEDRPLYRFTSYQIYGAAFGAVALGIARATLDAFITLAREKTGFQSATPMRENAAIQGQVAMNEVTLRSACLFLVENLRAAHEDAARRGEIDFDRRLAMRLGATYATQQAKAVVDACYYAAGATAIFEANPFERRFRDMHAVAQQSQARMMHMEAVGRTLLGAGSPSYAT